MQGKRWGTKKNRKKIWISFLSFMSKWRESFGKIPKSVCWLLSDHSVAKYGSQQQAEKLKLYNKSVQQCIGGTQLTGKQCSQAWIRPACSAGQFLCHSSHSYLFIKSVIKNASGFCHFRSPMLSDPLDKQNQKVPHEHAQLQLSKRKSRSWIKTSEY